MKCDICRERTAVIFVQQITKDSSVELHLCESCAMARGFSTTGNKIDISLDGIFQDVIGNPDAHAKADNVCPGCGFSLKEIKKQLKAGCAECYQHFRGEIVSTLRHEGFEVSYRGPFPAKLEAFVTPKADPENLKKELQKAIDHEDYELAAYYRDRLKTFGANQ
jgi:protein arginine kinase activator